MKRVSKSSAGSALDVASDLATFPEENPNPVLRVSGDGLVLFANSAARALHGLLAKAGSELAPDLASASHSAFESRETRNVEFACGSRLFALALTPVDGKSYVNIYGREITEERLALQQVHDIAKFPEENPNPVLRVEADGSVLFANSSARALPGLLTENGFRLGPDLADACMSASANGETHNAEFACDKRLFAFALTPVEGKSYVNIYGREITEERLALKQVHDIAKFPEENPNPVLRVAGDGTVLFANSSAQALPGLLMDGGRLASDLASAAISAFQSGQTRNVEFACNGRLFALAMTPVPGENYVNVYGREITEERRAHLEVVRVRNFNQNILDNLSNGVVTIDATLRVTSFNPAARKILGIADVAVADRALTDLVADAKDWLIPAIAVATPGDDPVTWVDRELTTASGERRSVNITLAPLSVDQDSARHMLVLEDITREKRVKSTMVRFMSDKLVERLLEADETLLGGTAQEATILFSDIRNFTTLSEQLGAPEMVAVLNSYFTNMVEVIFEHDGMLDKFIGDALMAVFGAPFTSAEDTDDAVQAATSMLRRLSTFNAERKAMSRPIIQIGIGIDTGPVVAGTIGSPRRMDYTVIGQHVNLAARIESVNKQYGTRILISEDTRHRLTSDWSIREIDQVLVPGLEAPVRLYEVLDYHTDETFPNLERVLTAYEDGLSCYRNRHWREAAKIFGHALNLNPNDRPTQIFLSRCWAFIARPPGRNWTGITDLSI